jgi:hypothetical protein
MANKEVTIEEGRLLIARVAEETGLIVSDNKGFIKVTSPGTGHKIYVQKTGTLGRIDCSLDLPTEEVGKEVLRLPLKAPNGAIKCHVVPTLEALEQVMRLMAAPDTEKREVNRPRPFAANRNPRPVTQPMPEMALEPVATVDGESLGDRLQRLKERGRLARVNRRLENDHTGLLTRELAEALEDGRISEDDLAHVPDQASREVQAAIEAGVEVEA